MDITRPRNHTDTDENGLQNQPITQLDNHTGLQMSNIPNYPV